MFTYVHVSYHDPYTSIILGYGQQFTTKLLHVLPCPHQRQKRCQVVQMVLWLSELIVEPQLKSQKPAREDQISVLPLFSEER